MGPPKNQVMVSHFYKQQQVLLYLTRMACYSESLCAVSGISSPEINPENYPRHGAKLVSTSSIYSIERCASSSLSLCYAMMVGKRRPLRRNTTHHGTRESNSVRGTRSPSSRKKKSLGLVPPLRPQQYHPRNIHFLSKSASRERRPKRRSQGRKQRQR